MAKKNKKKQQTGQQFLSPEQFVKQRARSLEIGTCYISEDVTECGEGHVIVTRLVDLGACGDFADVSRMIANPRYVGDPSAHETSVYKRYANLKKFWEK